MTGPQDGSEWRRAFEEAKNAAKQGSLQEAEILCDTLCLMQPPPVDALMLSAQLARNMGNPVKVAERLRQVMTTAPSEALRLDFAVSLMDINALTEAEEQTRIYIDKNPKDTKGVNILGVILKRQDRFAEAIKAFERAAKLDTRNMSPLVNMGNVYLIISEVDKALDSFSKALKIEQKNGETMRLLATCYLRKAQHSKALSTLQGALLRSPKNEMIRLDIAAVYYAMQQYEKALSEIEKAIQIFPQSLMLKRTHAMILRKVGKVAEAEVAFLQLLELAPNDAKTLGALAMLYYLSMGDREKANIYFEKSLQADPRDEQIALRYAECLLNSRYGVEAEHIEKSYQVALSILKNSPAPTQVVPKLHPMLLRCLDFTVNDYVDKETSFTWRSDMSSGEIHSQLGRIETMEDRLILTELHRKWGKTVEDNINRNSIQRTAITSPREKIRIGVMSSDLRDHPVTYFTQPILQQYDKSRFELYCYSFYPSAADKVQQQIMDTVEQFRLMPLHSDRDIAQTIANDQLDILFELGGTTHLNKIEICAYRPAPIQVSWLGYPNSSGLSTIDYILVDPYINPTDPRLLIEKPFMMPESWVTMGKLGFYDIPLTEIPQEKNGYVTFGTMNNPYKYTQPMIEAWATIMRKVEGSRFLFVRPEGAVASFVKNVYREFAKHGITEDRIEFFPVRAKHMPQYNTIDIALDTFPQTGGTTTCETLWMGVPVVTNVGPAFYERLSYSNLSNAGLGDLCAHNVEDFIRLAVNLAGDKERRKMLKRNLRNMIATHPLGQQERFVRNFEAKVMETLKNHREQAA